MRFCAPGASDACNGQVFNVGGAEPISHRDLVSLLIDVAGAGTRAVRAVAGGEEGHRHRQLLRRLEPRSERAVGWEPRVSLRDGLRAARSRTTARTCAHYLDDPAPDALARVA